MAKSMWNLAVTDEHVLCFRYIDGVDDYIFVIEILENDDSVFIIKYDNFIKQYEINEDDIVSNFTHKAIATFDELFQMSIGKKSDILH